MEAHRGLVRKPSRQRAEPAEGARRLGLVELPDGGRDLSLGVRRRAPCRLLEGARGGHRPADPLQAHAVEEALAGPSPRGATAERVELARGREPDDLGRRREGRDEGREGRAGSFGWRRFPASTA